jgi:NAD(P)-dependent dehydrogenase (short-subunit alcohol dehydrogenase family)
MLAIRASEEPGCLYDREFGGIDILVNNAAVGLFGASRHHAGTVREVIDKPYLVFYCCHAAIPH